MFNIKKQKYIKSEKAKQTLSKTFFLYYRREGTSPFGGMDFADTDPLTRLEYKKINILCLKKMNHG